MTEEAARLTDSEWREFQNIPEQGYSHRAWIDARIAERLRRAYEASTDPAALAEALAADLCQRICALVGEPRLLVPGEVQALLLASPEFARLIAAERAEALREAAEWLPWRETFTRGDVQEALLARADETYRVEAEHE